MGAAVALRKKRGEPEHEPAQARAALGPAEKRRRTPTMERLLGLAQRSTLEPEQRRHLVREMLIEELHSIVTLGASDVKHVEELLHEGKQSQAITLMVGMGVALHMAKEIAEIAGHVLFPTIVGAAHLSPVALAVHVAHVVKQLSMIAIVDAHAKGERDAAVASYAETWARIVTDALYAGDVVRPARIGLDHVDEARAQAYRDAMDLLRSLDETQAKAFAAQLKQELGTRSNARHALTEMLLSQAGVRGVALFDAPVR